MIMGCNFVYATLLLALSQKLAATLAFLICWLTCMHEQLVVTFTGRYGIRTTDSTFGLIKDFAHVVQSAIHYQPPRQECRAECWVPYSQEGRDFCVESKTACNTYWDVWNGHRKYKGMTIKDVNVTVWGQEVALTKLKFFASWSECCRKGLGAFEEGCSLDAGYSSW